MFKTTLSQLLISLALVVIAPLSAANTNATGASCGQATLDELTTNKPAAVAAKFHNGSRFATPKEQAQLQRELQNAWTEFGLTELKPIPTSTYTRFFRHSVVAPNMNSNRSISLMVLAGKSKKLGAMELHIEMKPVPKSCEIQAIHFASANSAAPSSFESVRKNNIPPEFRAPKK
jgi:hypothetical protein